VSHDIDEPGEGNSPAAWTAVTIMLIAVAIGTYAFCLTIVWLIWASVALLVVGAASGWVLAKAGYGVKGPKYKPKAHH
jgi:membrane protein YdbS with pleckstrin-like domain